MIDPLWSLSIAVYAPVPSLYASPLQVAHQLLGLYSSLLPALRSSALRNCPAWMAASIPRGSEGGGANVPGQPSDSAGGSEADPVSPPSSAFHSRMGSVESMLASGPGGGGGHHISQAALDDTVEGRQQANALFEGWAAEDRHVQWKSLQWVVQVRRNTMCR